eukprot:scaffold57662_cov28-Phaeocystis_antarctica.AAC.1
MLCSMWKVGRRSATLLGGALTSGPSACCVAATHGGAAADCMGLYGGVTRMNWTRGDKLRPRILRGPRNAQGHLLPRI